MSQDLTSPNQLEVLQQLQNLDADLFTMNELKVKRPQELHREEIKVEAAEEFVQQIKDNIKSAKIDADKSELNIKTHEGEIEKVQVALNTARSNEEYQVFQNNIKRLKEEIGTMEEVVLEKMNVVEKLQGELETASGFVTEAQKEVAIKRTEVEAFVKEVEERISKLEVQRSEAAEKVKPDTLEIYSRVLSRYPDSPLAQIEGEVCQGCHMAVTKQLQSKLLMGTDIVQCLNCSRILFF